MPQPKSMLLLVATTSAVLLMAPAQAQQISPAQPSVVVRSQPASGIQRVVDECLSAAGCSDLPMEHKTVTMQIPRFSPGDELTHIYTVLNVHRNGNGSADASPDESGILKLDVVDRRTLPGADPAEEEPQYFLAVTDVNTLEVRVTLDLYQVKLLPFVSSLQTTLWRVERMATQSNVVRGTRAMNTPMIGTRPSILGTFNNVDLSIRGENLTIDEVLDAVYRETGCIVNNHDQRLEIGSCP